MRNAMFGYLTSCSLVDRQRQSNLCTDLTRARRDPGVCRPSTHAGGMDSHTHGPPLPLRDIPGTHFSYRLSRLQGAVRLETISQ
jgi:hypothetical protein